MDSYYRQPQSPVSPPPPRERDTRRPSANYTARFFLIFIIIATTLWCIVSLILFLFVLHATPPLIFLDSFTVSGLNATHYGAVSGVWDIGLTVRNRDEQLHAHYDHFQVKVVYNAHVLGVAHVPSFDQDKKSQTLKMVKVMASPRDMELEKVNNMKSEKSTGRVKFVVEIVSDLYFSLKATSGREAEVDSKCEGMDVEFGSDSNVGKMSGGPMECGIMMHTKRSWWEW